MTAEDKMSAEAKQAYSQVTQEIENSTARRHASFGDLLDDIKAETAAEG